MVWIKLTRWPEPGNPIYINVDAVAAIFRTGEHTVIRISEGVEFDVTEEPEEIFRMIREDEGP